MSHHGPVLPGCHGVPVRACAWQLPAPLYKQTAVVLFYTVVQSGWASTAVRTKQIEQSLSYETARLCVCVCVVGQDRVNLLVEELVQIPKGTAA